MNPPYLYNNNLAMGKKSGKIEEVGSRINPKKNPQGDYLLLGLPSLL